MPTKAAHVAAANQHQRTIDYLRARMDEHLGWVVTVGFYKALHMVEALFAADPKGSVRHTNTHEARNRTLRKTPRYAHIWKHYRLLYSLSLIARYLREDDSSPVVEIFSAHMPAAQVESRVLGYYLHEIEASIGRLLNEPEFLEK